MVERKLPKLEVAGSRPVVRFLAVIVDRGRSGPYASLVGSVDLLGLTNEPGFGFLLDVAYDEQLAERVRDALSGREAISERKMFGGIAFMLAGNMAVGVTNDDLMVRLGAEDVEAALAEPHVRPMDFTGKPLKGFVFVSPEATATDEGLAGWVDAGADFAASLPPK